MGVGDCTSLKRPFQILIMGINPYPPSPSAKGQRTIIWRTLGLCSELTKNFMMDLHMGVSES